MDAKNGSTSPTFYATGNAHLDIVWLWPYGETLRKTARTFAAQLRMLERYPDYKFIQSQPQSYVMCRERYPQLYEKVKDAVKAGNWIVEGGMWVEPDTNMSSGEALIRQLVHGKRFFKDEFDVDSEILWLPDTFGYSAALPQILNGCGIKYLVTQKIFWSYNDGEQFPYHYFRWQGNDGSKVISFLPTSYTYDTNPASVINVWEDRVLKDDMDKFLFPFGYGDGGGGPCRDHIEFAMRQKDLEGAPKVEMTHPAKLFHDLDEQGGPEHTYVGELYFTAHRGVYTTQAAIKRGNRKSEIALREGELWGTIAAASGYKYPAEEMDAAWKKTLVNQFHDILPGSSIKRANVEAVQVYDEILESVDTVIQSAASYIAGDKEAKCSTVFNSLGWERTAVVALDDNETLTLVNLPPCGYVNASSARVEIAPECASHAELTPDGGAVLENGVIRAKINNNGEVTSFVLKESKREYAGSAMNRFDLFRDTPRVFDAWDIDSMYEMEAVKLDPAAEISLLSLSDIKAAVQIKKKIGNSTLCQTVSICAMSRRLEFDTTIEWNELHRLLKVCFPVNVIADEAINEIQHGYIKRPTHRSRDYDKDRFEVCNHRYTAICDENQGAAVLNDCKYGVSTLGSEISLTLLRGAACPEMRADNGTQRFTYAFTAWEGSFYSSPVVREGYELNTPPLVIRGGGGTKGDYSNSKSYFWLDGSGFDDGSSYDDGGSVILDTVKPAEDGSGDIILRLYESKRADCNCTLFTELSFKEAMFTDMLENTGPNAQVVQNGIKLHFKPFEVKTLRLKQ
jgi:alpha-mannosidase